MLANIPRLVTAYFANEPDPADPAQRVAFGTSGHRGSSLSASFNERHVLAISQAICDYRRAQSIGGPLFLGIDTHALSEPAAATALEVLAANAVDVMLDARNGYVPTPAVSHAILSHNRDRPRGLADGIVVTPSHNPPEDGGFKYDPPPGGAADSAVTGWIQSRANDLLAGNLASVARMPHARALRAATTHAHDYLEHYVSDLATVVDMDAIRASSLALAVHPLGGAGVRYWPEIAERYRLPITVLSDEVDPTFRFVPLDHDGKIRMDCSSPHAMAQLIGLADRYDVAWACDADHDRHGIVARGAGLLNPNHFLVVTIEYLVSHRPAWRAELGVGKTVVSSALIDRLVARLGRPLVEVPVGFKWFVEGLANATLGFAGEESAGATCLRRDGTTWTTDKDGIVLGLLAAEMTAVTGRNPGERYRELAGELGDPVYERIDAPATPAQKARLGALSPAQVVATELAGEPITAMLSATPATNQPIGGLKVTTRSGWFAARPSGTESLYKLYAESFVGVEHLRRIQEEGQSIVARALQNDGG